MSQNLLSLKCLYRENNERVEEGFILKITSKECELLVDENIYDIYIKGLVNIYNDKDKINVIGFNVKEELISLDATSWKKISGFSNLTDNFINVFSRYFNWDVLSKNKCLNDDMIIKFSNKVNFQQLSQRSNLSLNIIRMFKDQLNWYILCYIQKFPESFLREMVTELKITQVSWCHVGKYQQFSDSFLKDHMGFICENASPSKLWVNLAENQELSEEFILANLSKLNWELLCTFQNLSTRILLELAEIVKTYYKDEEGRFWSLISAYQELPVEFLREHKDKINWRLLVQCKELTEDIIVEFKNEMGRLLILQFQNHLSRKFLQEHLSAYTMTEKNVFCPICLETVSKGVKTSPCNHEFCGPCLKQCLNLKTECPMCRGYL